MFQPRRNGGSQAPRSWPRFLRCHAHPSQAASPYAQARLQFESSDTFRRVGGETVHAHAHAHGHDTQSGHWRHMYMCMHMHMFMYMWRRDREGRGARCVCGISAFFSSENFHSAQTSGETSLYPIAHRSHSLTYDRVRPARPCSPHIHASLHAHPSLGPTHHAKRHTRA